MILTGEGVALGVCKKLGISNFNIINELLPGIPLSSVDHGVAAGKAGEGRANEESIVQAIDMAIDFAK